MCPQRGQTKLDRFIDAKILKSNRLTQGVAIKAKVEKQYLQFPGSKGIS